MFQIINLIELDQNPPTRVNLMQTEERFNDPLADFVH